MRINLYADGEDDLIHEAYYFAAIWQLVGRQVLENRSRLYVHLVKLMYVVGYGKNLYDDECRLLQRQVDLCKLYVGNGKPTRSTTLAVKNEAELMLQCENEKDDVLPAHDKNWQHRTRSECVELLDTRVLVTQHVTYPK